MIVAALPAVVFVAVDGLSSLYPALAAACAAALAGVAWRLRRVYTITTLVAAAVNVVNAAVQAVFYLGNDPVVLAAAHIATGPVFAVIVAVTIVLARRAINLVGQAH